jgi:protein TonB
MSKLFLYFIISVVLHFVVLFFLFSSPKEDVFTAKSGKKISNINNFHITNVVLTQNNRLKTKPIVKKQSKPKKIKKKEEKKAKKKISKPKPKENFKNLDAKTAQYLKLYGEKYFALSSQTKIFLKENLSKIAQITQSYLRYPNIAIRTRQEGINVVEFYLYKNGDISDVRLLKSSQYESLDKNSIKTIKLAYQDYPLPTKKTKIIFDIRYNFY